MTCLLCGCDYQKSMRFFEILSLHSAEDALCQTCSEGFVTLSGNSCHQCSKPIAESQCLDCKVWEKNGHMVSHRAIFRYNTAMKEYFSAFKFQGDFLLCRVFAKDMARLIKSYKDYAVVPVPLSSSSFEKRCFNQVTAFLDAGGISYHDILERRESEKQSQKKKKERLKTTQVFTIKKGSVIPEKILLVDDIYTTGVTIKLVSDLFKEYPVKSIRSISLAR